MPGEDELDRILDRALAQYSEAEPLAGLEERVLQRVRVEGGAAGRSRSFGWVLAGLSLIAIFAVTAIIHEMQRVTLQQRTDASKVILPPVAPIENVPAPPAPHPVSKRRVVRPGPLPKQKDFPARTPMTAEERALMSFVKRAPEQASKLFSQLRETDAPIEIAPLTVEPLPDQEPREP